jgi:hypothetical protein
MILLIWDFPLNFNFILLLFFFFGCGVKGDPSSPKSENLHSLIENYPDIYIEKSFDEKKKLKR